MTTFETGAPEVSPIDPLSIVPSPGAMGELFVSLRSDPMFRDGKLLADAVVISAGEPNETPPASWGRIASLYAEQSKQPHFDAKEFWHCHFALPEGVVRIEEAANPETTLPIEEHINNMWGKLRRVNPVDRGGLMGVPHEYYVPGERFDDEMYCWDTFFTYLGFVAENNWQAVAGGVENQGSLIHRFGHVPNSNRDYMLSRAQPPVFSHMVEMLAAEHGEEVLAYYGPLLKREYQFWMSGASDLPHDGNQAHAYRRVVRMQNGSFLNRYYDDLSEPRQESYLEDVETAEGSLRPDIYRDIRASAESGWDFSATRWCTTDKLHSMRTTDLIPIDLNAWLAHLEQTIADASLIRGEVEDAVAFAARAGRRIEAINFHCWDEARGIYSDYDFQLGVQTGIKTMAMSTPLFTGIASRTQATRVTQTLANNFLKPGGFATTLVDTDQQWDGDIGWAPLNYKAVAGMQAYADRYEGGRGFMGETADEGRHRWLGTNRDVYRQRGHMYEKYNVLEPGKLVSNGEYPGQKGFGWTNGVFMALREGVDRRLQAARQDRRGKLRTSLN